MAFGIRKGIHTTKPSSSSGSFAVTPADHLLKQFSLMYLVDKKMSIRDVAKKLNATVPKIKSFFDDPIFIKELEARIKRVTGVDSKYLKEQEQISLFNMYEELRNREVKGELKDVATRDLFKMIIEMQREIRLDTPGAFTSKVGVVDLGKLQGRYKNSLSGRIHRIKNKKKGDNSNNIKRINSPSVGEAGSSDDRSCKESYSG